MLLKLNAQGAESPILFQVEILDNVKADLKMFLSTENPEPSEKRCQRAVNRMRTFKFAAEKKARYFELDDVCYIKM